MKMLFKSACVLSLSIVLLIGCKKSKTDGGITPTNPQNPAPENEQITTLFLKVTDTTGNEATKQFRWKNPAGFGQGGVAVVDTIKLTPDKYYKTELLLLDETKSPVDTVSNEIEELAEEHQFFFYSNPEPLITTSYLDKDKNNVPIGLNVQIKTSNTARDGNYNIILRHQPETKPKTGMGDFSKGSTDIDAVFPVVIK